MVISCCLNLFDVGLIMIGFFDGKGSFNVIKDVVEFEGDVCFMFEEVCNII